MFYQGILQRRIARYFPKNWWPAYRKPYRFTSDWFTYRISEWKKILHPLKGQPAIKALEIGTWEGRSALWLLENILTHESASIMCVDPLGATKDCFLENLEILGTKHKLILYAEPSEVVLPKLIDQRFDLIYIDGGHEAYQVATDADGSWKVLKKGGILIFDDYRWREDLPENARPKGAINAFLRQVHGQYDILHNGYQLVLRRTTQNDLTASIA